MSPRVILCDLDGVVWLAHTPIPGSVDAVRRARDAGCRVLFVTNNSFSTLEQQYAALKAVGIEARGDVVSSALAAALLVEPGMRTLVCGGEGLREAVAGRGAHVVSPHVTPEPDGTFDAVVVGFYREFTWDILRRAATAVRRGAVLIGANSDPTYPTPDGPIPGGGSILAAIERASETGAIVAGKPHEPMARLVAQMTDDTSTDDMVMIGDRIDTDGAFARTLGCPFMLVLSGSTSAQNAGTIDAQRERLDSVAQDLDDAVTRLLA